MRKRDICGQGHTAVKKGDRRETKGGNDKTPKVIRGGKRLGRTDAARGGAPGQKAVPENVSTAETPKKSVHVGRGKKKTCAILEGKRDPRFNLIAG